MRKLADLYDHQERALAEIIDAEGRLALFFTIGAGKTAIALSAINMVKPKRCLVLGTVKIIEEVWIQEQAEWAHLQGLRLTLVRGTPAERLELLKNTGVLLLNYELLIWLMKHVKINQHFDMVVFDELSKLKAPGSKRFRRLRAQLDGIRYKIGLTGTPCGNSLLDLWAEMFCIDGGECLGARYTNYRGENFMQNGGRKWSPLRGAQDRIHEAIKPRAASLPELTVGMPKILNNDIPVEMPPAAQAIYEEIENEFTVLLKSGERIDAVDAAGVSNKLRQILAGAVYLVPGHPEWKHIHDAKLDKLAEVVDDLQGEPLLVFTWFRFEREMIQKRIASARDLNVVEWNKRNIPVMVLNPASAGHGLNLQHGGSTVLFYSLPWSSEYYDQGIGRLARIGQKSPFVTVSNLTVRGSMDTVVAQALAHKHSVQSAVLEAVKRR